ncbi:MAG: carbonic anhydrase, partial [Pseudobdellovibrionaceae bacterium]
MIGIRQFILIAMVLALTPVSFSQMETTPQTPSQSHEKADTGVNAKTALAWLKNGNTRYLKGTLRKDGQSNKDRERLVTGQKPHTIILSCSDSRVPPEVLFDQKLGEIFVIRTAGEALDNAAIASVEYALEHLGSHLLVVMGHESCGAVKAAFSTLKGEDAGSPALDATSNGNNGTASAGVTFGVTG